MKVKNLLRVKDYAISMAVAACFLTTGCENDDFKLDLKPSNLPVSVIGNSSNVASKARYIKDFQTKYSNHSSDVKDDTKLIIINGNEGLQQATESHLSDIKAAYDAGAQIMVVAPDESKLEGFVSELNHTLAVKNSGLQEGQSGDFCDAYVFNNQNYAMIIKDLESAETTHYVTNRVEYVPKTDSEGKPLLDADGNKVFESKELSDTTFAKVDKTLSPQQTQAVWDNIDEFINTKTGAPHASEGNIADGQHVYLQRTASYNIDGYTATQLVEENYTITAVYSYAEDRDFYMVEQEINTINSQLDYKREVKHEYDGDDWLVSVNFSHGVIPKATLNLKDNSVVHLSQASPNTTTGSSSFTSGVSYNISGNVGFSMSGPTGGFTGGVMISNTHTTSIPDVMVTKKTIDDGGGQAANNGYVCWDYEIALPRV
ncbi:MAG: hypothetical protein LBR84_04095, partial [Tannerella sp.]|nr:hypothetical protein [Tannerella sp.]